MNRQLTTNPVACESLEARLLLDVKPFEVEIMIADPSTLTRPAQIELQVHPTDLLPSFVWMEVGQVDFWRDANGDGTLNTDVDQFLGTDFTSYPHPKPYWYWEGSTADFSAGENTFFAQAKKFSWLGGEYSIPGSVVATITNVLPEMLSISADPTEVNRPESITLSADATDPDGSISAIGFYRDADGNGLLDRDVDELLGVDSDGSDGWSYELSTAGLEIGQHTIFGVAADQDNQWGSAESTTILVHNVAPTAGSLSADPGEVQRGEPIALTANDVADIDGLVTRVSFFRDADGDGLFNSELDQWLGDDNDGADGWSYELNTTPLSAGGHTLFAVARDSDGVWSEAVSASIQVNNISPEMVELSADPNPVIKPTQSVLYATATDADREVAAVTFYYDADGDGMLNTEIDALLGTDSDGSDGWSMTVETAGLTPTVHGFLAQAQDTDGALSGVVYTTLEVQNLPPVIGSLSAEAYVYQPEVIHLSALGVVDSNGTVAQVQFYHDTDRDGVLSAGDTLLGTDTDGSDGWSIETISTNYRPMEHTFLSIAQDDDGAWSNVAQANVVVDLVPVAVFEKDTTRVLIYDLDGPVDISAADIKVKFGKNGKISYIALKGRQPMQGLGILVDGASYVGKVVDARKGVKGDVFFIASDAAIGSSLIRGNLAGWNLNGVRLSGVQFDQDIDGDGNEMDLTGLQIEPAPVMFDAGAGKAAPVVIRTSGRVAVKGQISSDIVVTGGLKRLAGWKEVQNADILIGESDILKAKARIAFGQMSNVNVTSLMPVSAFRATEWLSDGDDKLQAPVLGRLKTTGKKGISAGDFEAEVNLTNSQWKKTLGSARIAGQVNGASWSVNGNSGAIRAGSFNQWDGDFSGTVSRVVSKTDFLGSDLSVGMALKAADIALGGVVVRGLMDKSSVSADGSIGRVIAGALRDSDVYAGLNSDRDDNGDGVRDLFDPELDVFVNEARIGKVKVMGLKDMEKDTVNANIMAASLGIVDLLNIDEGDGEGQPFGVAANSLDKLIRREADGVSVWPPKNPLEVSAPPVGGNFTVSII